LKFNAIALPAKVAMGWNGDAAATAVSDATPNGVKGG
jgi:hypothetical protein